MPLLIGCKIGLDRGPRSGSDLQPADECERRDLTAIGNSGQLALKETDVRLEVVSRTHLNEKKVVAASLGFLARDVLREKGLSASEKL